MMIKLDTGYYVSPGGIGFTQENWMSLKSLLDEFKTLGDSNQERMFILDMLPISNGPWTLLYGRYRGVFDIITGKKVFMSFSANPNFNLEGETPKDAINRLADEILAEVSRLFGMPPIPYVERNQLPETVYDVNDRKTHRIECYKRDGEWTD